MIKTYLKTLWRMFSKHVTRLLSLVFMVLISVGFISGIGSATDKINYSLSDYYKAQNVSDFIIKSKLSSGFSDEDVKKAEDLFGSEAINVGNSLDLQTEEKRSLRLYFLDFVKWTVNVPDLTEGNEADPKTQVYAEQSSNVIKGFELGEEVTLDFKYILQKLAEQNGEPLDGQTSAMLDALQPVKVTVSGIVKSPLTFARDGTPSYNNPEDTEVDFSTSGTENLDCIENILYISKDLIPTYKDAMPVIPDPMNAPFINTGDIYVAVNDRNVFNSFSPAYKTLINDGKKQIEDKFGAENVEVLTLYENYSFQSLNGYSEKVAAIGYVLMVAFLLVTALVTLSTMTRMLDEERSQIACLKTLGYSSFGIVSKYALFAMIATGIGGAGAYFVGLGLARLLYVVFNYSFAMPPISSHIAMAFYQITFWLIVVATLTATLIAGFKMTGEKPANLLRPKPPKAGRKVILEKIPLIWNRLSFKYKSTVRNVLRYKSRFVMTVIAVALSTALVMAGLALLDLCIFHDFGSVSIMGISAVIVIFAGLLTAVVIYTLTNINISERNREIATLMVLGYQDREVAGYIYREIYINSAVGIIFGYPFSAFLIWLVFKVMGVGTLGGVSWFMWLIAPVIVVLFTMLVTLILRRKIVKINMNDSLKAIE